MNRMDRFYRWCGFGRCRATPPQQSFKGAGHGGSNQVFQLTVADRLRILVSGKVMVDMAHTLDVVPKFWYSTAAFSVLPPNEPIDP